MTLPETFNAATYFVDRNIVEGRGGKVAIECGDERVTYQDLAQRVNRFANALRTLGLQPEQRIVLLQQFHDILPGSAIAWVHQEAERNHAAVAADLERNASQRFGAPVALAEVGDGECGRHSP